jgi:AAA ATPase domain
MRITRLLIQNFRSNEDLTFEVPQICALIGPNNAGKNNILEALRRVLGRNWVTVSSFSPDDVFMHDSERAVTISCWLDPPVSYHRFKGAPSADIHAISFEYTRYTSSVGLANADVIRPKNTTARSIAPLYQTQSSNAKRPTDSKKILPFWTKEGDF